MTTTLRPLGDRLLIRPDPQATMTESGLHLVEHRKPETRGTVVAVGRPRHPLQEEAQALARRLEAYAEHLPLDGLLIDAAQLLRDVTRRRPVVEIGEDVVFSWQAGQELFLGDGENRERFLLLREDELLAVVLDDEQVA